MSILNHLRLCDSFLHSWWLVDAKSWLPLLKSDSCTVSGRRAWLLDRTSSSSIYRL